MTAFPFDQHFDQPDAPIGARRRRAPRALATATTDRFSYPSLDRPATTGTLDAKASSFTEAELAAAVAAAQDEVAATTEAKLRSELQASLEHRQAAALAAIAEQLVHAQEGLASCLAARAQASRDLALAMAHALVPRALAQQPLADIEAMLRDCLGRLEREPWLELRLPPDLVESGQALIAKVASDLAYRGEVDVVPDPGLGAGNAKLCWQEGAAVRDLDRIEAEAVALVDAWLGGDRATTGDDAPPQADEETTTMTDDPPSDQRAEP